MTFSCTQKKIKDCNSLPNYFEPENDLDKFNLHGKVRYIADYVVENNKPQIQSSHTFNEQGMLSMELFYRKDSTLLKDKYYKYDDQNRIIWLKENIRNRNTYLISNSQYDASDFDEIIFTSGTKFTDSLDYTIYIKYDEYGNILKDSLVEGKVIKINNYNNTYNSVGKLIKQFVIENDSILMRKTVWSYNDSNQIAEVLEETNSDRKIFKFKWDDKRLINKRVYTIDKKNDTTLDQFVEFDKLYNSAKFVDYEDDKIINSTVYVYEYDMECNWTMSKSLTDYSGGESGIYQINREIVYWE